MPQTANVVCDKMTEHPFSGQYDAYKQAGTYLCRQCGLALFRAKHKFHSGCGWPSFDEPILNRVKEVADADGVRKEIICMRCKAHLGHVFHGEGFTSKNIRHCVNSISLDFVHDILIEDTEEAIFAAGCFWGVEYCFKRIVGVLKTEVGYTGGQKAYPLYQEVCRGDTKHVEAVRVIYDPQKVDYATLTQQFFQIHDPTQMDGQGPDRGSQYLSIIFYYNEMQKTWATQLLKEIEQSLKKSVSTQILPVTVFWPAEEYHQDYYDKRGEAPYCHRPPSSAR